MDLREIGRKLVYILLLFTTVAYERTACHLVPIYIKMTSKPRISKRPMTNYFSRSSKVSIYEQHMTVE